MLWRDASGVVHQNCVTFCKVNDEYGEFSNMSSAFRLRIGDAFVPSSEALYQVCRFPDQPEWQREILAEGSAMAAKMKTKKGGRRKQSRADWYEINVDVMRWTLRVKLAQHYDRIAALLRSTRERAIVEQSRKDSFWGAIEEETGTLSGQNQLGLLLMDLREEVQTKPREELEVVAPPNISNFQLLGEPIGEVCARR